MQNVVALFQGNPLTMLLAFALIVWLVKSTFGKWKYVIITIAIFYLMVNYFGLQDQAQILVNIATKVVEPFANRIGR